MHSQEFPLRESHLPVPTSVPVPPSRAFASVALVVSQNLPPSICTFTPNHASHIHYLNWSSAPSFILLVHPPPTALVAFKKKLCLFIYVFLAALACVAVRGLSPVAASWVHSHGAGCRFLTEVASPAADHGL